MLRRNFIKSASLSSLAAFSFKNYNYRDISTEEIIKPKKLKEGDTLGLIAPGGFITEDELKTSINNIESSGFKAAYAKNILARYGYLAGTDKQRTDDLHEMFSRKDIDGIITARGGYGCARILPLIDYNLVKNNPKVFVGYSDITALLYGIYLKTGLVCFHGPVGISTFNDFSIYNFKTVLLHPDENLTLYSTEEGDDENLENEADERIYTIRSGRASGKIIGGNLSIVTSLIGTPYDIDTLGKLIFLEEIEEEPYRIDRMLTQMIQAGHFDKASGVVLGKFENCEAKEDKEKSFSLKEVLFNCLYDLNIPVIYGLSFGHIKNKLTLPIGIKAELNTYSQTITLLEKAVN